jgi:protocatechuate 3,4-dioxygenase, alpha subunit
MPLYATAAQTIGPFFSIALSSLYCSELGDPHAGPRVVVDGQLFDGDGPASDAILELWQADAKGRYPHPEDPRCADVSSAFRGFGRVQTDREGRFRFSTVEPGSVAGPARIAQAPHLSVVVFMRGLMRPVYTRMYFPRAGLNGDPIVARVPPARRNTLIAQSAGPYALRWDVHLQGENETVFFEF